MKKKIVVLILLVLLPIFFIGCSDDSNNEDATNVEVEELEKRIDELEDEKEEYEEKINILSEEVEIADEQQGMEDEYHREVIERHSKAIFYAIENLNEKKREELVKKLWGYELSIDDEKIDDTKVTTGKKEFWVRLSENSPVIDGNQNINEIINTGKISGNYNEYIKSMDPKPDEETMTDGTVVIAFHYIYQDLKSGDSIKIEISDELKERLGLDSNTVEINVE